MILLLVVAWRRGSREKGSCEGMRRMWEEGGGCGEWGREEGRVREEGGE